MKEQVPGDSWGTRNVGFKTTSILLLMDSQPEVRHGGRGGGAGVQSLCSP